MIDVPLEHLQSRLKTRKVDDKVQLYDIVRKQYVVMQPEEVVRQLLIHYLTEVAGYPLGRIQIEKGVITSGRQGRFDVIVYDKHVNPWMLVECKSHKVQITQNTYDQLAGYNATIRAPYHLLSNGINTYCYEKDVSKKQYVQLEQLPAYPT